MKHFLAKVLSVVIAVVIVASGGWYIATVEWGTGGGDDGSGDGELPGGSGDDVDDDDSYYHPSGDPAPTVPLPVNMDEVLQSGRVKGALGLSGEHMRFLSENGLVGLHDTPVDFEKFADAYEWITEEESLPVFVTSDSMMDAYHLIFDELLVQIEQGWLIDDAISFTEAMVEAFDGLRDDLPAEHRHLAEENVAFFGAALRLFDPDATVPDYAEETVDEIVSLAENASGFIIPPGFERVEDFSQYKPRGHYTRSEELKRYFRGMMWYGRITFQASYPELTRRAVMIALEVEADAEASRAHGRISSVVDYMVGAADDLTHHEYAKAAREVFGDMGSDYAPLFDDDKLDAFLENVSTMRRPRILSDVIVDVEDWEDLVQGMRVFGQRFVPDSYVFQNCVHTAVPGRLMPTALDVMAAFGSEEAWEREDFEAYHEHFEMNLGELRDEFADLEEDRWNDTLYMAWLDTLRELDDDTSTASYPSFMNGDAWRAKQLNTQLGSWTQLTHDTLLYRKQSYTQELSVIPEPIPSNFTYVEPVPDFWARLKGITSDTLDFLQGLGLSNQLIERILGDLIDAVGSLKRVAICELEGEDPDPDDLEAARYAYKVTTLEIEGEKLQSKTVVVSDVHTDPNSGSCLEEAVGYVRLMVVIVPSEDGTIACVGPIFEHHEFIQPLSEGRLADEEWAAMLEGGTAPQAAEWARDFIL